MKIRFLLLSIIALLCVHSCEEDDENLNGTGKVSFSNIDLIEVENATIPLGVNIAINTYNHSGGTIEVLISGANYGTDYESSKGSASFTLEVEPQTLVATFSISPIDNEVIEDNKNLVITLASTSGAIELGEITTMSFTIIDNDNPLIAIVGFENTTAQIEENNINSMILEIPFDQATTDGGTITVSSSGDAIYGTDYSISGQTSGDFTLTIPGGATATSFEIQAIDNSDFAADKTVTFTIDEVTGGLAIGGDAQTIVAIVNDDASPNPIIDFDAANTLTYNEDAGTVTLNFVLSEITTVDTTIELTTSGSADASDFNFGGSTANPYSFVIPSGSASGSVVITIIDDADTETDETIVLDITSVSGGLDAGLNLQQQTIIITDNDDAFEYIETFETLGDLASAGYQAFTLSTQDLSEGKIFKYNMNAGKYADVNDVTEDSDTGLVIFYSNTQEGNGVLDNVVITPQMQTSGNIDVSIDIAYIQAPEFNNANITFYYSESYNGSEAWNESDWTVMGTETAAGMFSEGIVATGDYKRKVMNITTTSDFYISVRLNQTVDDTFWKTQWRLDNFKVN